MVPVHTSNGQSLSSIPPELLDQVADKAYATLGDCDGRLAKAVALVRNGEVTLQPDGLALVQSQSVPGAVYHVNGSCQCADYGLGGYNGWCKHKLAAAILTRIQQALPPEDVCSTDTSAPPLPEAPASVNVRLTLHGREVQVTLRDTDETRLLTRLETLLARFPVEAPTQASTAPQTPPVCPWHGPMKESTKAQGTWYCSKKMADGSYCKARHPEKAAS